MRVLIFPFPRCMWGGHEGHPYPYLEEQLTRIHKAILVAQDLQSRNHQVEILCTGGLFNQQGISLAQTLATDIIAIEPTLRKNILIGEMLSTHTAESIRFSKDVLTDSQWDKVIAISTGGNPGHIDRIRIYMENICPGITLETVASAECGSPEYRQKRARDEKIMMFLARIDRQARIFDFFANRRRAQARLKP